MLWTPPSQGQKCNMFEVGGGADQNTVLENDQLVKNYTCILTRWFLTHNLFVKKCRYAVNMTISESEQGSYHKYGRRGADPIQGVQSTGQHRSEHSAISKISRPCYRGTLGNINITHNHVRVVKTMSFSLKWPTGLQGFEVPLHRFTTEQEVISTTATEMHKLAATGVAQSSGDATLRVVASHMTHNTRYSKTLASLSHFILVRISKRTKFPP